MLTWLLSNKAMALSCLWGLSGFNFEDGDQVPLQPVFVASHTFAEPEVSAFTLRIVDEDDMEVPATVEWEPFVVRITPDVLLEQGMYRIVEDKAYYLDEDGSRFEIADLPALALEVPGGFDAKRRTNRSIDWGTSRGVELNWDAVEGASHYEIELATDEGFEDPARAVATWTSKFIGDDLCGLTIEDYDHTADNYVRIRAVGLDGTTSEWTTALAVGPSGVNQILAGCAVAGVSPVGGLTLVLTMGLLGIRRRV